MKVRFLHGIVVAIAFCSFALAGPGVGEKPDLQFTAVGGEQVSLARLRGKIIVIDFWATWCGPCMHEAPHMVALNTPYADQGLQMIGISLDQDKNKIIDVAKASGFTWPQYFDGGGWQAKPAQAWGVNSIPRTFLIGPDGVVLWSGHPARLEAQLAKAFKEHPPVLVDPAVLAAATKQLDAVEASLKAGDTIAAMKAMSDVPADAKKDGAFAVRLGTASTAIEAAGDKLIDDVEPMVNDKNYTAAAARLVELMKALPNTPIATKAQARYAELMKTPAVKAAIDADRRNTLAAAELDVAEKLKEAKKDEAAYLKFKSIAKTYAGTPPGDTAAAAVAEYEKDTAFVKRVNESAGGAKAKAALSMAASYVQSGRIDLAKKKYQDVIDQFPGTSFAATAKTELAKLN
ncbi:hypothetical protein BH10PLA1_BH10PLA1_20730 [soil metagenome]